MAKRANKLFRSQFSFNLLHSAAGFEFSPFLNHSKTLSRDNGALDVVLPMRSMSFFLPRWTLNMHAFQTNRARSVSESSVLQIPNAHDRFRSEERKSFVFSARKLDMLHSHPNILLRRTNFTADSQPSQISVEAYNREVEEINREFVEARDQIEMAVDSKDTVYFNEEAEVAKDLVESVVNRFDGLLSRLDQERRSSLERFMGLKMAQLKGELQTLQED